MIRLLCLALVLAVPRTSVAPWGAAAPVLTRAGRGTGRHQPRL